MPGRAIVEALGAAMIAFAFQGTVVAVVYVGLRGASRRAGPAVRYVAGLTALIAMAVAFVATFALLLATPRAGVAAAPFPVPSSGGAFDPATLLATVWLVGEGCLVARVVGGLWIVRSWVRRASHDVPARWTASARRLAARMRVRRVRVASSADVDVPVVAGWLRPVVLIPRNLERRLPWDAVESLIAHEIAHLARFDTVASAIQRAVETLLFFHPAVWWISSRVDRDRELCADDLAVAHLGDATSYARALAALEFARHEAPVASVAANGGTLVDRIRRQLTRRSSTGAHGRRARGGAAALVVAGGLGLAVAAVLSLGAVAGSSDRGSVAIPWLPESVARYVPLFEQASSDHGVDADLLAIVALVESGGNPSAESSMGAVGLMQIMPATAESIADARGLPIDRERLLEPETSVDFAAWFLARHMEEFTPEAGELDERRIALLAAAYNGGPVRLRDHLAHGAPLSDETSRYRDTVVRLWRGRLAPTVPTGADSPGRGSLAADATD